MTKNEVKIDEVVKEEFKVKYSDYNKRYTKTALFIMPMLDLDIRNTYIIKFLDNAFLDDKALEHSFVRPIFLLFSVPRLKDASWLSFSKTLEKKETFLYDYYVGESEKGTALVMYVFKAPDKYIKDYYAFKMGKYSTFSDAYKKKFPKNVKNNLGKEVESKVWGAMYKSEALKQFVAEDLLVDIKYLDTLDEIWDAPNKEEEYYRYNLVKEE